MRCSFDNSLLIGYNDKSISLDERNKVEEHIRLCRKCAAQLNGDSLLLDYIKKEPKPMNVPVDEIISRIYAQRYKNSSKAFILKKYFAKLFTIRRMAYAVLAVASAMLILCSYPVIRPILQDITNYLDRSTKTDYSNSIQVDYEWFNAGNMVLGQEELVGHEAVSPNTDGNNEFELCKLFAQTSARAANRKEIFERLRKVDWRLYNKVSNGGTMQFLEWLSESEPNYGSELNSIFSATNGLDGIWSDQYSILVSKLFKKDMLGFVKALTVFDEKAISEICGYVSYNCSYSDKQKTINEVSNLPQTDLTSKGKDVVAILLLKLKSPS